MTGRGAEAPAPVAHSPAVAAALLDVSEDWLEKRARRGEVPFCQFGRRRRYTDAHIAEIAEKFTRRPVQRPGESPAPRIPARRRKRPDHMRVAAG